VTWVFAAVGFMLLVILHEAGHFAAAKAVGMRVEKFSLFFGPMLVKWRRGETVYGIGPIPLGGYVRISGMNPYEELPPEVAHRAYFRQPVWKRIVVILAGPGVNLLIAFVLLWGILSIHGAEKLGVDSIERGSAAAGALQPKDRLLSVDGRSTQDATEIARLIGDHKCAGKPTAGCRATTPVHVVVLRDGKRVALTLTPRYDAKLKRMRLGFAFGAIPVRQPVVSAAGQSITAMWDMTSATVSRIGSLLFSEQARKDVHGVVGGYEATRQAVSLGVAEGLSLIAGVSLALGIVNLFPFLPLDGGHVLWAVIEKLRGRSVPFWVMERAGFVGFALVILLAVVGFTNDVDTLRHGGNFLR
jgi:regulator of sigma E protease